ncbi:MAG: hypothetical protein ACFCBW_17250 [Candidatus Competibacterales bacterium]
MGLRYPQVQGKPVDFLALMGHTVEEFQTMLEPFEAAFRERMST